MSTYVISDIHGCFDEFLQMLRKIQFSEGDRLYLAGDYIDRGKQNLEMLRWLENCPENIMPIKGNHDAEFAENIKILRQVDRSEELDTDPDSNEDTRALLDSVNYLLRSRGASVQSFFDFYGTLEDLIGNKGVTLRDLCKWQEMISAYPYFYRFPMNGRDCVVVHAGYCEDDAVISEDYGSREEFYLYAREEGLHGGGIEHGMIVAGHTPTIAKDTKYYTDGYVFRYYDEARDCVFYDIDCGCAYYEQFSSGTLACLRLEDEEMFYL